MKPSLERSLIAAYSSLASRTMAMPTQPEHHLQFEAEVVAVQELSPAFRRITLQAEALRTATLNGPDEYFGLFMPPRGQRVALPEQDAPNPRSALARIEESERPELRWYSVRTLRVEQAQFDTDIVSTGHDGPGSRWVAAVQVGDAVGVRFQTAPYTSAPPAGRHLLLADETGLPALLAILDHADDYPEVEFEAIIEVPGPDYIYDEAAGSAASIVHRGTDAPGSALLSALEKRQIQADYAWICAEGTAVAAAKRFLIKHAGVPRRSIMGTGFWRLGRPRP